MARAARSADGRSAGPRRVRSDSEDHHQLAARALRRGRPGRHRVARAVTPPDASWPPPRRRPPRVARRAADAARARDGQRRRHAGAHGSGVAKQRMDPGQLPRGFGVGRREYFEAAGGIGRDQLPVGRVHGTQKTVWFVDQTAGNRVWGC